MFTEKSLRKHPELIKALVGIPAEVFWEMIEHIEMRLPDYERHWTGLIATKREHRPTITATRSTLSATRTQ